MSVGKPPTQMDWYAIQTRFASRKDGSPATAEPGHYHISAAFEPSAPSGADPAKSGGISLVPRLRFLSGWYIGPEERLRVLRTEGVVIFVGTSGQGIAIPEKQIEHVQNSSCE